MLNHIKLVSIFVLVGLISSISSAQQYFPELGKPWKKEDPARLKVEVQKLNEAVQFAKDNEYVGAEDLRVTIISSFSHEPYHHIAGPTKKRGGPAGLIIKNGYVIAQWGDIHRVDMTFSVTKSYLSTMVGLAFDKGLIRDLTDPVADYVWDGTFEGVHNAQITWDNLLTQSSDWSGTLFGMKDWADRPPKDGGVDDWKYRELNVPGSSFKYNDVRVNVLAYSILQVLREPLPKVLKGSIMDPIGASSTWRWYGYDNSWVNIDGTNVQSVSGGGHSGGGMFISTEDQARFGLLFLRDGNWNGRQLISTQWVASVQKSSVANASYGYMWWLNRGARKWEGVDDETIYFAAGFGGNYIVVDKTHDLLVVTRWLNPSKLGNLMQLVEAAMKN